MTEEIKKDHRQTELRIVIPCFGEEVAPRFEAARHFRLWIVEDSKVINYVEIDLEKPPDGFIRIRLMEEHGVNVIVCNGISEPTRQILKAKGCKVVQSVMGSASDALFGFLAEKIVHIGQPNTLRPGPAQPDTADLVEWTISLVRKLGWSVTREYQPESFPVDIVAGLVCPVCGHDIRIAICCGAHAFRVDEEIREFHCVTVSGYHARTYIHQQLPGVVRACKEYGIHLVDPATFSTLETVEAQEGALILLGDRVTGHERLIAKRNQHSQSRGII